MANSGIYWSLEQHKRLFDQLVKLRFSGVFAATYHHHPWAHYSFRGVERTQADLCYGFKHRFTLEPSGVNCWGSGRTSRTQTSKELILTKSGSCEVAAS